MTDLIGSLKAEHGELKALLDHVKSLGIGTAEGRAALNSARDLFQKHLAHEDRAFYPAFLAASAKNPHAARMAKQFADEMTVISRDIMAFFDKYRSGGSGLEYARDFGKLSAALFLRWSKEENILYARFAELSNRAPT